MSRICLGRDENERAISICKDAIELCGNENLKYKAMLYNTLGTAYMELNKAEESIKNYKESYKCSKNINYGEGLVLALNNLAVVYGDYYQRADKTEEYLLNAKEICENDKLIYYEVLALVNLGEVYLGKYDYEKSLKYFLEGLRKSKEINFEKIVFYSLNQLSMVYYRLNDYEMAYRYYTLSEEEFKNYKKQVREEADFYRLQGEFLFNIGSIERSQKYLEESLKIYNDQEFTLKWKSEIQIQYLNLIKEDNPENLRYYIEKIEILLGCFKEESKRFEVVYDTVLILYKKGKRDLALSLLDKYKFNSKNNIHPRINIKYMHVNSILAQDDDKIELLHSALKTANRLKEHKIKCELCIELGNWYLHRENYVRAANYYFESCKIIRQLLSKLPEIIKEQYIKVNNLDEPFYKLIDIRNNYMDNKVDYTEVNSTEELLEFKYSIDMLKESVFIEEARVVYSKYYSNTAKNELDIINNLTSDSMANLEIILRYLSWTTLATKGKILLEGENEKYVTLVSLKEDSNDIENINILKKVKNTKVPMLLNYPYASKEDMAIICIPIIMKNLKGMAVEGRKKNRRGYGIVKGYIYLSSDKVLNNFNDDSLKKCMNLTSLIDYILEKYQLKVSSSLDTLTGTLTRQYLEDKLEDLIEEAIENKGTFSLIMFDLDNFKNVNDNYGHQIGDEVLKKVSSVILENIRSQDICGRYGGEEFIILLPNVDKEEAKKVSDRLRRKIKKKVILGDSTPVTISMGIASYPEHGYLKYELIEKADHALYVAKDLGKDRCEVWKREFGSDIKHGNKLSGIVSGSLVQDSRNVSAIIELINVMNEELDIEKKIYKSLGEIMNILSAEYASVIYLEDSEIKERFKRKINEESWYSEKIYNDKIIKDVITQKQGICTIYWDEELEYDLINEVSEWYSVMASPVIKNNDVKYIIYVAVPLKLKRFSHKDLNFFNTMCKIIRLM
ncbi:diguanylate cyclase [Clostridium bovifaecis]|uniref:Diguanylate cyclase n=1 Tax=Clostridium bovifaecis TaxID=2184719 RepID=A0A6I6F2W1_9CLOT|nr:diguanylate cyclase [Clostridium bovifaecis]